MSGPKERAAPTPAVWTLEQLAEGVSAVVTCRITARELDEFARLSGDHNPLHTSREFAAARGFRDRVVHGAFICALVSRFVGMELPGRNAMLLSLEMRFAASTFPGDTLRITGTVASVHASQSAVMLGLEVTCNGETRARGKALVRVGQEI